jgi:hypothetical protein
MLERVEVLGHHDHALGSTDAASADAVTARPIAQRPLLRSGELWAWPTSLAAPGPARCSGATSARATWWRTGPRHSDATSLACLRLGRRLAPRVRVALEVFNLFDRQASGIDDFFYESRPAGEGTPVADRHFHPVEPRSLR